MGRLANIIFTIALFLLALVPLLWFPGKSILLGYDSVFPLFPLEFLSSRIYSWSGGLGFGMDQSGLQGSLIIHFIDSIPYFFGASPQLAQKVVMSFWFFAIIFSAYFLGFRLEKEKYIQNPYFKYIFSILYTFNFYILQAWWSIERTKFSLVVATPLILAVLFPLIRGKLSFSRILKSSVLSALILSIFNGGGWVGLPLFGGLIVVLITFYVFSFFIFYAQDRFRQIIYITLYFILFGISFVVVNAYTLLPFLFTTLKQYGAQVKEAGGVEGLIQWGAYLSQNTSFINLLRLQGIPDWYNNVGHPFASLYTSNPFLILLSFIFPVCIILSFLISKKENNKLLFFFLLLLLISLFFTAGSHKPLGILFEILMTYVPGFAIFRSAIYKFGYSYWLAAGFFIAFFLSFVLNYLSSKVPHEFRFLRFVLLVIVISGILFYHFPFFKGDIFRQVNDFSSRVELPAYTFEFASWWRENGREDKVLLLPELNGNWKFEQYDWEYLSLFPLLGNFASNGLVQNADIISPAEEPVIQNLYSAIDEGDYLKMDRLSKILGVNHFLLRNDFAYNTLGQKTKNPKDLAPKLAGNKNLKLIKSFGKWDLYSYKNENPFIFAVNSAVSTNTFPKDLETSSSDLFLKEGDAFLHPEAISQILITPECLNCQVDIINTRVTIPVPQILIDSNFYQFIEFKNNFKRPENETFDSSVFRIVGETLNMNGQMRELLQQRKDEEFIKLAKDKYLQLISSLTTKLDSLETKSSKPYSTAAIVRQYLDEELASLNELLRIAPTRTTRINIQEVIFSIAQLRGKLENFYGEKDINTKKIYKFNIPESGNYSIGIKLDTLGVLNSNDYSLISLLLNKNTVLSPTLRDGYLDFGQVNLTEGENVITLGLLGQKNILLEPKEEKRAGETCFSSYVNTFSPEKNFLLRFKAKNNFDRDFFYFVDGGEDLPFTEIDKVEFLGEQFKNYKVPVSQSSFSNISDFNRLRISFCSPSLTKELYEKSIMDLSLIELTNPQILVEKKLDLVSFAAPNISYEKINGTRFKVHVRDAKSPYYLVFSQRYSSGWKTSVTGEHIIGNNFENVWFLDKEGDYDLEIYYSPQKYFYIGAVLSILGLVFILLILTKIKYEK